MGTNEIINQGRGVLNSKSFDNNEDLLTYVKKASFLKLKAEIIKEQIHQTTIPDKNIEPIEKIGKYDWEVTSLIKQLEDKIKDVKSILETSCALQREVSKLSKNIEEQFRQL